MVCQTRLAQKVSDFSRWYFHRNRRAVILPKNCDYEAVMFRVGYTCCLPGLKFILRGLDEAWCFARGTVRCVRRWSSFCTQASVATFRFVGMAQALG